MSSSATYGIAAGSTNAAGSMMADPVDIVIDKLLRYVQCGRSLRLDVCTMLTPSFVSHVWRDCPQIIASEEPNQERSSTSPKQN